jgi:hypothetical protein
MQERILQNEEILFREGEPAEAAYYIVSGKIELTEYDASGNMQRILLEAGQICGEAAFFARQAYYTNTARVSEEGQAIMLGHEDQQALYSQCHPAFQPLLHMAFEKMRQTIGTQAPVSHESAGEISNIVIAPGSEAMRAQFQTLHIPVSRLPFRIGGYPEGGETNRRHQLHLAIASNANPLMVSRQHCEIVLEEGCVGVQDLGSRFCTTVNEVTIGRGRSLYYQNLRKGSNILVLGTGDSPYRIEVICE